MPKNLILNVLGYGLLISTLGGCSSIKTIDVSTNPVKKPVLVLPNVDTIQQRPIKWKIITKNNNETKFQELINSNEPAVFFGLDEQGYENLSLNLSDIRAFIQQQQSIIDAYESYYIESESTFEKLNKKQ